MTFSSPTELAKNLILSTAVEHEDERTRLQMEHKPRRLHTDPDKDVLPGSYADAEDTDVCKMELQEFQFLILNPSTRCRLPLNLQPKSQPAPSTGSRPPVLPSLQDSVLEGSVPQHQDSRDTASQGAREKMQRADETDDEDGRIPEVVITQADELVGARRKVNETAVQMSGNGNETEHTEWATSVDAFSHHGDGPDASCIDLQSLKSDSISFTSEATVSGKSYGEQDCQEEDTRSVTASSVMSLFQRLQMDPLEREWLRFAALGNTAALQQLLSQDPALASKKTALHWAAKHGRLDMAEMIARAGVDVNAKSHGYTALHLAAIHGHQHIIQMLLAYNATVNIRDYHGKMPVHYWNGSTDVFGRLGSQSREKWSRGRRAQRHVHLSSLLSTRSRSQGHLSLELVAKAEPPSPHPRSRSPS